MSHSSNSPRSLVGSFSTTRHPALTRSRVIGQDLVADPRARRGAAVGVVRATHRVADRSMPSYWIEVPPSTAPKLIRLSRDVSGHVAGLDAVRAGHPDGPKSRSPCWARVSTNGADRDLRVPGFVPHVPFRAPVSGPSWLTGCGAGVGRGRRCIRRRRGRRCRWGRRMRSGSRGSAGRRGDEDCDAAPNREKSSLAAVGCRSWPTLLSFVRTAGDARARSHCDRSPPKSARQSERRSQEAADGWSGRLSAAMAGGGLTSSATLPSVPLRASGPAIG